MRNDKKIVALTTFIFLLFIFGTFLLPITKATETYITTEEIEDFSCIDDTYVYSGWSYVDSGNSPLLTVGYDVDDYTLNTEFYIAFFKFDLTNRPENYIKAEVILTFNDYGVNTLIPVYISNNSWSEEGLTYEEAGYIVDLPPTVLPFSFNSHVVFGIGFVDVSYDIDITEYSEFQFISFGLGISYISSDFEEDISTVYSKEYPVETVRPKIIWTVEVEHTIKEPVVILEYILFALLGLIIGTIGTAIPLIIKLKKNKRAMIMK